MPSPIRIALGDFTVACTAGLPPMYKEECQHAQLVEEFEPDKSELNLCCVSVSKGMGWPLLVVTQTYFPGPESGFYPGVLLVPETGRLFVGAGSRIVAYDLEGPTRLWEDAADMGFWAWARHGNYVVMAAELELAAWTLNGEKVSSSFVEPPWEYSMDGDTVHLDVMGEKTSFDIRDGRPAPSATSR